MNDLTPTPLPTVSFDQTSVPVDMDGIVIFDTERQEKWAAALAPFPQWEMAAPEGEDHPAETITVTLAFTPNQLIEVNLDQDEALEIVLLYLFLPPNYHQTYSYESHTWYSHHLYGDVQLAVFDDDDELLWKSETVQLDETTKLELMKVNLAPNLEGVFFSYRSVDSSYRNSREIKILYIWQDSELKAAWRWENEFVSSRGSPIFFLGTRPRDEVAFQDIDGDGFEELLFVHGLYNIQDESDCCFSHYYLRYPGVMVYKWNDEGVRSAFLLAEDDLHPIRPQSPTALAPFVERPIVVDGDITDWPQVEYVNDYHDLTYDECDIPGGVKLTWDDDKLYIRYLLLPGETVRLALDTGLATDFTATTFDMDDVLITVRVDRPKILHLNIESGIFGEGLAVAAAVGERISVPSYLFPVELSIPLEQLGLGEVRLTNAIGWGNVEAHLDSGESNAHFYYPTVQAMIGFAVATDRENEEPMCFEFEGEIPVGTAALDLNNPTTWGTLLFTADRGTPDN